MKYPAARILVFARAPVPGTVKTRLAKDVGFDQATRLYAAMLEHTVATAAQAELAGVSLFTTPDARHPSFLSLQQRFGLRLEVQNGKDLGERMLRALEAELQLAEYALLIGTDCPGLDASYLDSALARLQQGDDVVIGPAEDGGYVLIGVRRPEANLFREIPWSTDRVMEITCMRCDEADLRHSELGCRYDIDTWQDYQRFLGEKQDNQIVLIQPG